MGHLLETNILWHVMWPPTGGKIALLHLSDLMCQTAGSCINTLILQVQLPGKQGVDYTVYLDVI